jgi:hypothetical protein
MSFVLEYEALWTNIQANIASIRAGLGLPALNGPDGIGTGTIPVGREFDPFQLDAPSIVVVPTGIEFIPAQRGGERDGKLATVFVGGPVLYTMHLEHEAIIWGDPDPAGLNTTYDFSSTLELVREFVGALVRNLGNSPALRMDHAKFEQPEDVRKRGRYFRLPFAIKVPLVDEPFITLPFATQTTTGVTIDATIEEIFPDGSSTIAGVIQAPP